MNIKDIMNSENKSQTFAILMVTGIIFVVIACIYSLIMIWTSTDNGVAEKTPIKIGEYEIKTKTNDDMAKYYYSIIFGDLISQDYDRLYERLDPAYVVQYKIKKENFQKYIEKKKISDINLILEKYENQNLEGYNKIYILYVKTKNSDALEKIIVKEKSPNNFVIAFDGYISYDNSKGGVEKEGLMFTLQDMEQVGTQITIKMYIKNVTTQKIILNKDKEIYAIKALTNNNLLLSTVSDTITGRSAELAPQQEFSYTAVFNKTSKFENIVGINIGSVYYGDSKVSSSVTYEF